MDFPLSTLPYYAVKNLKKKSPNPRQNTKIMGAAGLAFSLPWTSPAVLKKLFNQTKTEFLSFKFLLREV